MVPLNEMATDSLSLGVLPMDQEGTVMRKINVEYLYPPIPIDCWYAATYDGYEPGDVIGYGRTSVEAVESLQEQVC